MPEFKNEAGETVVVSDEQMRTHLEGKYVSKAVYDKVMTDSLAKVESGKFEEANTKVAQLAEEIVTLKAKQSEAPIDVSKYETEISVLKAQQKEAATERDTYKNSLDTISFERSYSPVLNEIDSNLDPLFVDSASMKAVYIKTKKEAIEELKGLKTYSSDDGISYIMDSDNKPVLEDGKLLTPTKFLENKLSGFAKKKHIAKGIKTEVTTGGTANVVDFDFTGIETRADLTLAIEKKLGKANAFSREALKIVSAYKERK